MNPEEFRKYGHQLIDWIADYRLRVADLPVRSRVQPGSEDSGASRWRSWLGGSGPVEAG